MDDLDRKILNELQESRSLTPKITEIAKKLGRSSTTVHSRIKRMERQGVIQGYSAQIDPAKLGMKLNAFYFIKTGRGAEEPKGENIIEKLVKHPNVRNVYNTMGEWDLVLEFIGRDSDDYIEFMKYVEPLPGVRATKGKSILKTYNSRSKLVPE
jgi:Lrp/AsnC family transcriptional regulator for asnA, asnC and gidA